MTDPRVAANLKRGEEIGKELLALGKELFDLGEVHEARHVLAALQVGNTTDCDETCPLHYGNPKLTILPSQVRDA